MDFPFKLRLRQGSHLFRSIKARKNPVSNNIDALIRTLGRKYDCHEQCKKGLVYLSIVPSPA